MQSKHKDAADWTGGEWELIKPDLECVCVILILVVKDPGLVWWRRGAVGIPLFAHICRCVSFLKPVTCLIHWTVCVLSEKVVPVFATAWLMGNTKSQFQRYRYLLFGNTYA